MNEPEAQSEQEATPEDGKLDDETLSQAAGGNAIIQQMNKDLRPPA
ncbi:MAG: hypothetical protein WAS05_03420 [Candidatus Nanopelagicales bacterium]